MERERKREVLADTGGLGEPIKMWPPWPWRSPDRVNAHSTTCSSCSSLTYRVERADMYIYELEAGGSPLVYTADCTQTVNVFSFGNWKLLLKQQVWENSTICLLPPKNPIKYMWLTINFFLSSTVCVLTPHILFLWAKSAHTHTQIFY